LPSKEERKMSEKPYVNVEFYVAGVKFHEYEAVAERFEEGAILELVPEPTNEHDENAIRIHYDGVMLGYVPARTGESKLIAQALNLKMDLQAIVTKNDPEAKPHRRVKVWIQEREKEIDYEDIPF
jgi:hypothetical protein